MIYRISDNKEALQKSIYSNSENTNERGLEKEMKKKNKENELEEFFQKYIKIEFFEVKEREEKITKKDSKLYLLKKSKNCININFVNEVDVIKKKKKNEKEIDISTFDNIAVDFNDKKFTFV
jgi:hypothetical protein